MLPSLFTRIAALLAALVLTNCATNPVTGNPNLVLMTESQEIALGQREDGNVRKQYGAYDNAAHQQYVSEIGERLAKAELARVLGHDEVNGLTAAVVNGTLKGEPVAGQALKIVE